MDYPVYQPDNSERAISLRRHRDALAISGAAVIAFSIWDMIKVFIELFLGEETLSSMVATVIEAIDVTDPEDMKYVPLIAWVTTVTILLLACAAIFFYHFIIGISAYRAGRQTAGKKNRLYLVLTVLILAVSLFFYTPNILHFFPRDEETDQIGLATLLVELTSIANYLFLLYSAYRIHQLEQEALS